MTTAELPDSIRVFLIVLESDRDLRTNSLFADTEDKINECDVVIKDFEQRLYGSEVQKQQEGKDVRLVVRNQQFQSNQQHQSEEENKNSEVLIQGEVQSQMLEKAIEEVNRLMLKTEATIKKAVARLQEATTTKRKLVVVRMKTKTTTTR